VCVCVGVRGVVLCRCVRVCDLLIFLQGWHGDSYRICRDKYRWGSQRWREYRRGLHRPSAPPARRRPLLLLYFLLRRRLMSSQRQLRPSSQRNRRSSQREPRRLFLLLPASGFAQLLWLRLFCSGRFYFRRVHFGTFYFGSVCPGRLHFGYVQI